MRLDLTNPKKTAESKLIEWRQRYSKDEYPEKVVINIFYRKYIVHEIFPELLGYFKKNLWENYLTGFQIISDQYSNAATQKVNSKLMTLIQNKSHVVGNVKYQDFETLLSQIKNGDKTKIEEIEFSYIHHYLTDETILIWAAFGGTGMSMEEAISKISGAVVNLTNEVTFTNIAPFFGQYVVGPFLKDNYNPLPTL